MKTAISIPDALNESIEIFLKTANISRSEFFQRAAADKGLDAYRLATKPPEIVITTDNAQ